MSKTKKPTKASAEPSATKKVPAKQTGAELTEKDLEKVTGGLAGQTPPHKDKGTLGGHG